MKKILIAALSAMTMVSANASNRLEQIVSGRVVSIEPMTQVVYHRVPANSCTVQQLNGRHVEQCRTYEDRTYSQRIIGYKVQFEYNGGIHSVVLKSDPGREVSLRLVTQMYVLE